MKIRFTTVVKVKCILYLKYREGICIGISNTLYLYLYLVIILGICVCSWNTHTCIWLQVCILQGHLFTDGSGQKCLLSSSSSASSELSSSSDGCSSDRSLLHVPPSGMPSFSPHLSHYSCRCRVSLFMGQFVATAPPCVLNEINATLK